MLTEIVFLKQSLIEKIEHALKNYIIDTNTNEENDIFMEFYFKDHVEILFNKLITHYYENVFGYDDYSFDAKLEKLFHHYKAVELQQNTGANLQFHYDYDYDHIDFHREPLYYTYSYYFSYEIIIDIILDLFVKNETNLK
jgi:hypothetical protein